MSVISSCVWPLNATALVFVVRPLRLLMSAHQSIYHNDAASDWPLSKQNIIVHCMLCYAVYTHFGGALCAIVCSSRAHLNLWWSPIITNQMYANCARNALVLTAVANQFNQIFSQLVRRIARHGLKHTYTHAHRHI